MACGTLLIRAGEPEVLNGNIFMSEKADLLLSVQNLSVAFDTRHGRVAVLDKVNFNLHKGETLAIVGESGSGKSVTAYAALGILDPAGKITHGRVEFDQRNLLELSPTEMRKLRGRDLAMIFQNPRTALNPIRKVGQQIEDVLAAHNPAMSAKLRRETAIAQLAAVKITDPARRYHAYPYELSGGMCQRVMIAVALACQPRLLIADEPTTGLDVTTQVVIMDLVHELAQANGMATILITHDLGLAADYCSRVAVMHAGQVLEDAPVVNLFRGARHPYTTRLMAATPQPGISLEKLASIPGQLPDLRQPQPPCRFSSRCDRSLPECSAPDLRLLPTAQNPAHLVACRNPHEQPPSLNTAH
jgi:peptide/nickel transport system ATP-binding protein